MASMGKEFNTWDISLNIIKTQGYSFGKVLTAIII